MLAKVFVLHENIVHYEQGRFSQGSSGFNGYRLINVIHYINTFKGNSYNDLEMQNRHHDRNS